MKQLTREILVRLRHAAATVTAAGMAHVLASDYIQAAPTMTECQQSLDFLVLRGFAERLPDAGFGDEYRLKERA